MSLKLYAEIPYKLVRKRSHGPVLSTPPPLPLIALSPDDEWEEFDTATQTGFGYALPYLPALDEPDAHKHAERGSVAVPPEAPRRSRLLSEYMTNNEFFQSPRHGFGTETRLIYKRNKELESGSIALIASMNRPDEVSFGATFESGNLDRAYRVLGLRYAPSHDLLMLRSSKSSSDSKKATKPLNDPVVASASKVPSSHTPFPFFVDVDSEYDLYAHTDVNTHGHVQWYFFRVTVPSTLLRQTRERGATNLKVRFNIRNMLKKASLYTDGMLPAVYIERPGPVKCAWHHSGVNVCYFKNTDTYRHRRTGKVRNYYTLSFVYEFSVQPPSSPKPAQAQSLFDERPFVAYFAHCYPYTYTRLQRFMLSMQKDPERRNTFKRRVMCKTIAGNNCDLLTITDFSQDDEKDAAARRRTAIVITARVHPGESNSSFVMHGILEFLTGNSLEARFLRHHFVFKVVPMLNPDGVVHGNYRCSLAGTDLNRRWLNPSSEEIEAALPDNFQDNSEEDGSVGFESDPSGDTTEDEDKEGRQKTPPKSIIESPAIEAEPVKLAEPVLTRNRPPRVTRHLSEPRLLEAIVPKQAPSQPEATPAAAVMIRVKPSTLITSKPAPSLAPLRKEAPTQRIVVCQNMPYDRNREIATMHLHAVQKRSKTRRNIRQATLEMDGS
ncbi:hypothetical protein PF011_g2147 [Phytophthora fragariae]|uniref:Peptidase M14 domain-containing protein n=1 Tax=Phytophthora fragariae TaxID=53985 RepID=A0A6A3M6Q4_9STRA|nr:hypothetical protein PF011_g2147 [Phytophthora fragariae]